MKVATAGNGNILTLFTLNLQPQKLGSSTFEW